jgi:hypothetical protein
MYRDMHVCTVPVQKVCHLGKNSAILESEKSANLDSGLLDLSIGSGAC